jgi:hypothetical protein
MGARDRDQPLLETVQFSNSRTHLENTFSVYHPVRLGAQVNEDATQARPSSRRKSMKKKHMVLGTGLSAALMFGGLLYAQKPPRNINPHMHPNLADAQRLCDRAYQKVEDAQRANEFDLGGHAAKAKDLLREASDELKEAAREANEHK